MVERDGDAEIDIDTLAWTQLLLGVIDEGRKVTTYKLAVLLALMDCCVLGTRADGQAPSSVSTRDLARRVVDLYWRQVRDYPGLPDAEPVLKQSSGPRAVTVDAVRDLFDAGRSVGLQSLAAVELGLPDAYARTVAAVELNLVHMPLGKLQRPLGYREDGASEYARFLYDDAAFHDGVRPAQLPLPILLPPDVGRRLVGITGLLRPLVEVHWTRVVARRNNQTLPAGDLQSFLFGAQRGSLTPVREGLVAIQSGTCFYCAAPLGARVDVDHFVPWSRLPNDALGNLVAAHPGCNNAKRDYYADLELVDRWGQRPVADLTQVAAAAGWPLRLQESLHAARGLYAHLPHGTNLWSEPGVFTLLDRGRLAEVLPLLDVP